VVKLAGVPDQVFLTMCCCGSPVI